MLVRVLVRSLFPRFETGSSIGFIHSGHGFSLSAIVRKGCYLRRVRLAAPRESIADLAL